MPETIPILPCIHLETMLAFYGRLGFAGVVEGAGADAYVLLRRGDIELHFFMHPDLKPQDNCHGAYIRGMDVDALQREYGKLGIPAEGMPCLTPVEDKPWEMREFSLVDPSGNLLRFGRKL